MQYRTMIKKRSMLFDVLVRRGQLRLAGDTGERNKNQLCQTCKAEHWIRPDEFLTSCEVCGELFKTFEKEDYNEDD